MSSLFIDLVSGKRLKTGLWKNPSFRLKFAARAFFLSPITFKWLSHLETYPLLDLFLKKQHNLPAKLQRPYLASALSNQQRFEALKAHHDFLSQQPKALTEAFYDKAPYSLARLTGKNAPISIEITASDKYSREGELTLFFFDEQQQQLATLTFAFFKWQSKSALLIAGIQGAARSLSDSKAAITQATKNAFGLFPKRILVDVVLRLATFFKLDAVIAVSNQTHVYNNWRYKSRLDQLHADYNSFWESLTATQTADHFYSLPLTLPQKPIEEIASKKRAEYRKRYAFLEDLNAQIDQQLSILMSRRHD